MADPTAHRRHAEELLALALTQPEGSTRRAQTLAEAQVHASLAIADVVELAATPQRFVLGAESLPGVVVSEGDHPEQLVERGAVLWAAPTPEQLDAADAVLTHPPVVAPPRRRSTPKKKEPSS